jgi:hypothetical protein
MLCIGVTIRISDDRIRLSFLRVVLVLGMLCFIEPCWLFLFLSLVLVMMSVLDEKMRWNFIWVGGSHVYTGGTAVTCHFSQYKTQSQARTRYS